MPSHTAIARERALASRLARFASRYFLLIVVAVALVVALVVALTGAYPHRTPETLLARDILTYQPLLLTVAVLLSIVAVLLPWLVAKGAPRTTGAKLDYRHHIVPLLCFGLGYANLLLGVVPTYLGLVALFFLGMIIDNPWRLDGNLLRTFRTRPLYPLALCTTLYALYTVVVALGWSTNQEGALDYWSKEIWLFFVPLCFLIYHGPSQRLLRSFWLVALRIGWVYIVIVLVFFYAILISCGSSPLLTFQLGKLYLQEAGFIIDSSHILMPFTFTHYTYIGFFLLTPIVMTMRSSSRSLRLQAECLLLGIILYACALQARYLLLMALLLLGYAVACHILDWIKQPKPTLLPYLMLVGSILLTLIYTTSPHLTRGYLEGGIRNELLQISYQALREIPIWIGGGLDYAYNLLLPLPVNTEQEGLIVQFHNQYLQTLVQSGIIGLLLWLSIFVSMLWIAHRQRNSALIVLVSLCIILCNVDLVSYIHRYLIGMIFLLCLALSSDVSLEKSVKTIPICE